MVGFLEPPPPTPCKSLDTVVASLLVFTLLYKLPPPRLVCVISRIQ